MNVNAKSSQRRRRMEEAPGTGTSTRQGMRPSTPSEVLAILRPERERPRAIHIGSLWKTGLAPEGAVS